MDVPGEVENNIGKLWQSQILIAITLQTCAILIFSNKLSPGMKEGRVFMNNNKNLLVKHFFN